MNWCVGNAPYQLFNTPMINEEGILDIMEVLKSGNLVMTAIKAARNLLTLGLGGYTIHGAKENLVI